MSPSPILSLPAYAHSSLHIHTCSQHWPSCLWGVATTLVLKGCGSPEQGPKRQERLPNQGPSELDLDGCTGVCSWRHRGKTFPVGHPSSSHPLSFGARVGTSLGPNLPPLPHPVVSGSLSTSVSCTFQSVPALQPSSHHQASAPLGVAPLPCWALGPLVWAALPSHQCTPSHGPLPAPSYLSWL